VEEEGVVWCGVGVGEAGSFRNNCSGEMRAMVLIDLLSRPHLISYETALLLPNKN
jgi:hypothetical protein